MDGTEIWSIKATVSYPTKRLNNVPERDAQVATHQDSQTNADPDKNQCIDIDRRL
jgi:hypothetical protein